jgi:hypothetical protein
MTERTEKTERTERARSLPARLSLSVISVVSVLSVFSIPVRAQQLTTAQGRVVRGTDSLPMPAARVLLHRVGRDVQGPVDSTRADDRGRFRFRFRADTAALYLLSVRYGGIEYFSTPVHTNPARPDTALRLVAYDTSSTAPIAVEARHIVVPRPGEGGTRAVPDLIVLRNDGTMARVSPDSLHPSWTVRLPPGTGEMQVGEGGDLSPDAIVRQGDTVKVLAPIAPGQKQLSLEYAVVPPAGRLTFDVGSTTAPLNVLVEEVGARVAGPGLALADSQVIEGRSFRRWSGTVAAGGAIAVTFADVASQAAGRTLALLVAPVALILAFAGWRLVRRPRAVAPRGPDEALLDQIAALDARYAGREAEAAPDEWRQYETERAALKARLEQALATAEATRYV